MPIKKILYTQKARAPKEKELAARKLARYVEGVGRRKTAVARVRISGGSGKVAVNGRDFKEYFVLPRLWRVVSEPFDRLKIADKFEASVKVSGGGIKAQAEAVRLGLSRAIALKNPDFRKRLRKLGFLTRDSRAVERKKYGLKKARRAPQWAKR